MWFIVCFGWNGGRLSHQCAAGAGSRSAARFQPGWRLAGAGQGAGKGTVPVATGSLFLPAWQGWAGCKGWEHLGEAQGPAGGWQSSLPWVQPWTAPSGLVSVSSTSQTTPGYSQGVLACSDLENTITWWRRAWGLPVLIQGWVWAGFLSLLRLFPPSFPIDFRFSVDSYLEAAVCFGQCILTPSLYHVLRVMDAVGNSFSLLLDCVSGLGRGSSECCCGSGTASAEQINPLLLHLLLLGTEQPRFPKTFRDHFSCFSILSFFLLFFQTHLKGHVSAQSLGSFYAFRKPQANMVSVTNHTFRKQ